MKKQNTSFLRNGYPFFLITILLLSIYPVYGQIPDTVKYPWPYAPMTLQRNISGTFGEYRSTSAAGHYHNGTDIPAAAGTPVYAVLPGIVAVAYHDGSTGYDSYVRVSTNIGGQTKNLTYYHTIPTVSVGQSVTVGQQISTVAIDHVHLIDYRTGGGLTNNQINSLRPDGGMTPYIDTWKPYIRYVKFHLDNTDIQLQPHQLGGKIDIISHVEEINGTSASARNNGTYEIGYKILSADSQTVVFSPPDDGVRFRYYNIPRNEFVNINYYKPESSTSKHVYIVTNGAGASTVASTQVVGNDFWNTDNFPYGDYIVMVFTKDMSGNGDTVYIPVTTTEIDLVPPQQPKITSVSRDSLDLFTVRWEGPDDPDLKGYRLYYSFDGINFLLRDGENALTHNMKQYQYSFNQQRSLYLRINAVDSAAVPNESVQSKTYGLRMLNDGRKILIVDGFNRYGGSGSWANPYHDFLVYHAEAFDYSFESCSNSEIINETFNLNDYHAVLWILGDESTQHETFSSIEQVKVAAFLENGGKLFLSGSEIAWDLEGASTSTASDTEFLRKYLKAKFVADASNIYTVFGVDSTDFEGIFFTYGVPSLGSPYQEDYPDVIDTVGGSFPVLSYGNVSTSAIAYKGNFNNSPGIGQLVYLGFPFETIIGKENRSNLMNTVMNYFGMDEPVNVENEISSLPLTFELNQNYPNPFNPETIISYSLPVESKVRLEIYNLLGERIALLINTEQKAGKYKISFDGSKLASGIYLYRIIANDFIQTNKMVLIK